MYEYIKFTKIFNNIINFYQKKPWKELYSRHRKIRLRCIVLKGSKINISKGSRNIVIMIDKIQPSFKQNYEYIKNNTVLKITATYCFVFMKRNYIQISK